jgi:DNA polymerase III alpha subunit
MRLDIYKNPVFNSDDVFNLLYQGNIEKLKNIVVDKNQEISNLESVAEMQLTDPIDQTIPLTEFDQASQDAWFIPNQYKTINIDEYVLSKIDATNIDQYDRVLDELVEFKSRGMYPLLQWLIYFVDTCIENNIVWGVGRGSSVSSYVLFLIGVHKIDSLKYNLSWTDFLR